MRNNRRKEYNKERPISYKRSVSEITLKRIYSYRAEGRDGIMNLKLKPCPFCGGEAYYRVPIVKGCENIMMVECRQCGASPYAVFVSEVLDKDDKKAAIAEKWNRRTQV